MLAMLKDQVFEIGKTAFQTLEEEISTKWARHQRVQGKVYHVALGSAEKFVNIEGKLVMQIDSALENLKNITEEQKPVLLTLGNGFAYWVVIIACNVRHEKFMTEGASKVKHFNLQIERYHYGE